MGERRTATRNFRRHLQAKTEIAIACAHTRAAPSDQNLEEEPMNRKLEDTVYWLVAGPGVRRDDALRVLANVTKRVLAIPVVEVTEGDDDLFVETTPVEERKN